MQRGQAFDAFKLLIAAVVAGAILVILLSMIGGFVPVGQDPLTVMGQELNKVKKGGVASTSSQVVQFSEGQEFSSDAVAREAGVNVGKVSFCCASVEVDNKCAGYKFDDPTLTPTGAATGPFTGCTADLLAVKDTVAGKIRAYCPTGTANDCVIGFKMSR